jgi:excisionase family DNA binding protein
MPTVQHHYPDETTRRRTLTIEEAARVLGIGRQTAYDAAATGELPTVRIRGRLLVSKARLAALLGEDPGCERGDADEIGDAASKT